MLRNLLPLCLSPAAWTAGELPQYVLFALLLCPGLRTVPGEFSAEQTAGEKIFMQHKFAFPKYFINLLLFHALSPHCSFSQLWHFRHFTSNTQCSSRKDICFYKRLREEFPSRLQFSVDMKI